MIQRSKNKTSFKICSTTNSIITLEEVTYLTRGVGKETASKGRVSITQREGMIARARSQRNRTKLELEHTEEADLGQKEGLFPE